MTGVTGAERRGCYPGSFAPLTVAHLAVAEAALEAGALDRVDLVLSVDALGRAADGLPAVRERAEVLREVVASRPWLGVEVREERLIADLAVGYDAVVLGADKWRQVLDPSWYGDDPSTRASARDAALARLPLVLVAPRADDDLADVLGPGVRVLSVAGPHRTVSASAIRDGEPGAGGWLADDPAVRSAADRWFGRRPPGAAGLS